MTNGDRSGGAALGPEDLRRERERLDWLAAQARGKVLDVGCGAGDAAIRCARRGLHVVGVDVASDLITAARAAAEAEPEDMRARLEFRVADARVLDLPDESFETVLLGEVLQHVEDPGQVLAAVARLVRRNGVLAVTAPFGLRPGEHQLTVFYGSSLLGVLPSSVTVEDLQVVDGHFRVVATAGPMTDERRAEVLALLQPVLEERLLIAERRLGDAVQRADTYRRQARLLSRQYSEQAHRARYVTWQLESTRARRWWRLGQALIEARRNPRRMVRLPLDLARALRKNPRPPGPSGGPSASALGGPKVADRGPDTSRIPIPGIAVPDGPVARPDLTVAVILDPFSSLAFRFEWNQVEFGPDDWREVVERERPRFLFVESAWRGHEDRWRANLSGFTAPTRPLRELIAWFRERGLPTVFWNKEDPPNFDVFIETARLFDWVFTVDGDCVERYRDVLAHDRIRVLSFAAQPRIHNPIAVSEGRRYDVAFAGTYYAQKHPERREQMKTVLAPALDFNPHIFSRVEGDELYRYPDSYQRHIVGSLPYERMLAAYKAYKVFLNVNSVIDSPTMCARRVFELSACSTAIVSGHSLAIERVFGDLVPTATTPEETHKLLSDLLGDTDERERRAHLAMREVMSKHTFSHRVDAVLTTLGLAEFEQRPPGVSVVLPTNRPGQIDHALTQVARQAWRPLQLVLVLHGVDLEPSAVAQRAQAAGVEDVVVRTADSSLTLGACLNIGVDSADGDLIAKMDDDNLYGEHYLTDLVHAFSYADAGIVGKCAYYVHLKSTDTTVLRFPDYEHRYVRLVAGATMLGRVDLLREYRFDDVASGEDTRVMRRCEADGVKVYSADRFSFAWIRQTDPDAHTWKVSDEKILERSRAAFPGPPDSRILI